MSILHTTIIDSRYFNQLYELDYRDKNSLFPSLKRINIIKKKIFSFINLVCGLSVNSRRSPDRLNRQNRDEECKLQKGKVVMQAIGS